MLIDELLDELEEFRGKEYVICFDTEGYGIERFKDINSIEVDEHAGVIHLKNDN